MFVLQVRREFGLRQPLRLSALDLLPLGGRSRPQHRYGLHTSERAAVADWWQPLPFCAGFPETPQLGGKPAAALFGSLAAQVIEWRRASSAVPHFQLVTTDGIVLGARELSGPDWPPGSVIYTGPNEPNLRVVRELGTANDDPEMHFTVLVVEAAS
jgi:hypothetical protein